MLQSYCTSKKVQFFMPHSVELPVIFSCYIAHSHDISGAMQKYSDCGQRKYVFQICNCYKNCIKHRMVTYLTNSITKWLKYATVAFVPENSPIHLASLTELTTTNDCGSRTEI